MRNYIFFGDLLEDDITKLTIYPGTVDRNRYARTVRQHLHNKLTEAYNSIVGTQELIVWEFVINSLLRSIKLEDDVRTNQIRLMQAHDILAKLIPGLTWRPEHLSIIATIPPYSPCNCIDYKDSVCYATIHNKN